MGLLNGAVYVTVLSRLWSRSVAYGTCRRPGGSVRAWYEVLSAGPVIGFACADSPALRTHGAALRLLLLWVCGAHAEGARNAARADHDDPNGFCRGRGRRKGLGLVVVSGVAKRRALLRRVVLRCKGWRAPGGRRASSARSAATVLNVAAFSSYLPLASTPHSVVFTPM